MEQVRINKYFSQIGYCSRRKADELIADGRVYVNGEQAVNGLMVSDEDDIAVDGVRLDISKKAVEEIWQAFYKPVGIVCSENGQGAKTVWEYLETKQHMFSVGRLDKESEGLLLITNMGDEANKIAKSRNGHEKEYCVTIDRPVTDSFIKKMSSGVEILDTVTKPCRVVRTSKYGFRIILTQGLNRQIRRMSESCGAKVTGLKRVRVCNILLGDMKPGEIRNLTADEIREIKEILI